MQQRDTGRSFRFGAKNNSNIGDAAMDNRRRWSVRLFLVGGILMIATAVHAQLVGTATVTDALSILMSGGDLLADVDLATYAAEAPGLGHEFFLFGNAQDTVDPENGYNDVISVDTAAPPTFGGAERKLGVKIWYLTNQIQLKYFFVPLHTCGVGTPRVFLTVDTDGDGRSNGNAFGSIGVPPASGACPQGEWIFENLTDNLKRWDLRSSVAPSITRGHRSWRSSPSSLLTKSLRAA